MGLKKRKMSSAVSMRSWSISNNERDNMIRQAGLIQIKSEGTTSFRPPFRKAIKQINWVDVAPGSKEQKE